MAETAPSGRSRRSVSSNLAASQQRIDLAHTQASVGTSEGAPLAASMDDQAAELAELLYARQTALDRREAELNAEQAEFEKEVRAVRLWVEERQNELLERESALPPRPTAEEDLADDPRPSHWDRVAAELERREQALTDRESELVQVEEDAVARRLELDRREAMLEEDRQGLGSLEAAMATREQMLEDRHREIDNRKAQLYRDIEQFASERVQLAGRQAEMEARRKELDLLAGQLQTRDARIERLEAELRRKQNELEAAECELTARAEANSLREAGLDDRESQLAFRHREIQTALARFERLGVAETKMQALHEKAVALENRHAFLAQAEAVLAEEQCELAVARQELDAERLAFSQDTERRRRQIAAEESDAAAELIRKRRSLEQREREANLREASLDQVQAELEETQREVLEMRLASEEIFAQLSGALAPASLARSIAQTREKISEYYCLRENELIRHQGELAQVRSQIAAEHEAMIARRDELEAWVRCRQRDVEEDAARLAAREKELDRQEIYFGNLERQWSKERGDYQQEIRRLLATLRQPEVAAA